MFGNKRFDVDHADNIIIDGVRYVSTPGLYELIFKRIPDDQKYKYVIAPLMSITPKKQKNKSGKGLPHTMILNDNAIDYVHWDDPNQLMNRLRLLDASHRAGNNAQRDVVDHEELREAGFIIN